MTDLTEAFKKRDVKTIVKCLFDIDLTPNQLVIVRIIGFAEHKRVCINAMTRYGKSLCVAIGVSIYLLTHSNKKIAIIAPEQEQAGIIRNYIAELISKCTPLANKVDLGMDNSVDRLKRETSRKRWTFTNGCELRTITAHGEANRLMGFGANLVIMDEAALISRTAYAKIIRMLGDDPENSILIELANPWSRDNKYYDHYSSGRFKTIQIGYDIALEEGRITQTFVDEVRAELTPVEFCVLYESKFPDEMIDSLFKYKDIQIAIDRPIRCVGEKIISCDVADKGIDLTVIMYGVAQNGRYKITEIYSEPTSDNMAIANKIVEWHRKHQATSIHIDTIGVGVGVVSRIRELLKNEPVIIKACHFGEAAGHSSKEDKVSSYDQQMDRKTDGNRKRYANRKAEQFWRLRTLFEDGMISIPEHQGLMSDLLKMRWEIKTTSNKIRIIDPEDKSPDFADALCYFTWKTDDDWVMDFGSGIA